MYNRRFLSGHHQTVKLNHDLVTRLSPKNFTDLLYCQVCIKKIFLVKSVQLDLDCESVYTLQEAAGMAKRLIPTNKHTHICAVMLLGNFTNGNHRAHQNFTSLLQALSQEFNLNLIQIYNHNKVKTVSSAYKNIKFYRCCHTKICEINVARNDLLCRKTSML